MFADKNKNNFKACLLSRIFMQFFATASSSIGRRQKNSTAAYSRFNFGNGSMFFFNDGGHK